VRGKSVKVRTLKKGNLKVAETVFFTSERYSFVSMKSFANSHSSFRGRSERTYNSRTLP